MQKKLLKLLVPMGKEVHHESPKKNSAAAGQKDFHSHAINTAVLLV
jgi:hypothetical protein